MKIQTRIIGAVMLVVAVVTIVFSVYLFNKERTAARAELAATIKNNETLLKVVTAGPLYDGNVEQLDAILDSLFTNLDMTQIELTEFNGNIRLHRTRTPAATLGETITNHIVISRSIDQLGEINTTYSTTLLEERLLNSRNQIVLFSFVLVLGLSGVIFLVARGLTGPIKRLTVAARDMASGHLDREISTGGAEELQSLGQSFIRMRDAIREKIADLAARNEALRISEEQLNQAVRASQIGIFDHDQRTDTIYWSPQQRQNYGWSPDEPVMLAKFIDQIHPEDRERIVAAVRRAHDPAGDGLYDVEHRIILRDGEVRWLITRSQTYFEGDGDARHPVRTVGAVLDITERRNAEEAQRASEEVLRAAVSVAQIGIFDHDQRTDTIYWSPQQRAIHGWGPDEPISLQSFLGLVHPEDRDRITAAVLRAHDPAGDGIWDVELRIIRRDGSIRWLKERSQTFFEGEGDARRPVRTIGAVLDITDQKLAEQEREKLQSQLNHAQRMESIGRLAGGVAHDFNNMLSVILGYATMMKGKLPAADPLMQYLQEIEYAAVRSRDLTSQLLAFSRKQVIDPKVANLHSLIKNMQNALTRMIGEDVELRVISADGLWNIKIDPMQVDQIIMNLAVNARDAMPSGGSLTIETTNVQLDEAYCRQHAGSRPGPFVLLTVSDNGSGMSKEVLSHVFEPFFTTKEFGKGTGLGLATVYGIVNQNNGFISVYSEAGQGTIFKIYLPRAAEETARAAVLSPAAAAAPLSGAGTILLVEDDAMVRELALLLLKTLGYSVLVANSPAHALSLCERKDIPIDLLMTDVVMPGMNGKELLRTASAIRPGIRVLFMSGYTANVIAHHGVLEEGIKFIQKPFSIDDLAQKVQDAIRGGA
jgi:PAS domain S-box-containing protein